MLVYDINNQSFALGGQVDAGFRFWARVLRDLEGRVVEATRLGAVAYIPSGRGGEIEVEPEEAEVQLELFEE